MKRILAFLLTLTVLFGAGLSASAATVSVADEILDLQKYYANTKKVSLFEEVLAFASLNMLSERIEIALPGGSGTENLAQQTLIAAAGRNADDAEDAVKKITDLQKDDGSFGSLTEHCLSMLALRSQKTLYNSAKAYQWLKTQQNEDGSFGTTAKETALAVAVLALSENEDEISAKNNAAKYFATYQAQTESDLCWQIIGITDAGFDANTTENRDLLAKLLTYRNNTTFSYSDTYDTTEAEALPTALALLAYDAVNRSASAFLRLAQKGNLSRYTLADFKPMLIFAGVMVGLSAIFWVYVFVHKKNTKTLDETKNEAKEALL